jgi:hypothetical protein
MLNSLDVLVGFTVVMLVVSMAVTMLTQAIGTSIMNLRGKSLHEGLTSLLALMDQGLSREQAKRIADHILRNPLVSAGSASRGKYRLASVIHRDELTKLLLDFAVPGEAAKADPQNYADEASLRHALRGSLARNGIPDPEAVLRQVRSAVVELERRNPEASQAIRSNVALLNFAASDYLAKLNSWFDQTVDRTSELFTRRIRIVTALVALGVALTIQLDSIGLINRLSVDQKLRDSLVERALQKDPDWCRDAGPSCPLAPTGATTATPAEGDAAAPAGAAEANQSTAEVNGSAAVDSNAAVPVDSNASALDSNAVAPAAPPSSTPAAAPPPPGQAVTKAQRKIEELGVVNIPTSGRAWWQAWWQSPAKDAPFRWPFLLGVLLSAALLSLGAPFWYSTLANLLKMRSLIAQKDEGQRSERQTTQKPGSFGVDDQSGLGGPMASAAGPSGALTGDSSDPPAAERGAPDAAEPREEPKDG